MQSRKTYEMLLITTQLCARLDPKYGTPASGRSSSWFYWIFTFEKYAFMPFCIFCSSILWRVSRGYLSPPEGVNNPLWCGSMIINRGLGSGPRTDPDQIWNRGGLCRSMFQLWPLYYKEAYLYKNKCLYSRTVQQHCSTQQSYQRLFIFILFGIPLSLEFHQN